MEILGYIAAAVIGLSLGMIGGGGSTITVPILVYLFAVNPVVATAYSLFIVGATSLAGSMDYLKNKLINLRAVLLFGVPSTISVFVTRKWIVPALPERVCPGDWFCFTRDSGIMVLLALMVAGAAWAMIRHPSSGKKREDFNAYHKPSATRMAIITLEGLVVGALTGLVGAGGGFLIVPALVVLGKLDMKVAVGTSLLIIAAKSLLGFLGDLGNIDVDWSFLLTFTAVAIGGIFFGVRLVKRIRSRNLQKVFGWFLLVVGVYVLMKELLA